MTTPNWSPYQLSIFSHFTPTLPTQNLLISAVAGSGKTTTIVEAYNRALTTAIPISACGITATRPPRVLFLAFNKAIADELASRNVNASTFHSLGMSALRSAGHKPTISKWKIADLIKSTLATDLLEDYADLSRLISIGKGQATLTPSWHDIITDHGLTFPSNRKACEFAQRIFDASLADLKRIDFDDMLLIPWFLNLAFPAYDLLFVDEAQDTNPIQLALITAISPTRIVAVGDRRQAIYGFRGAGTTSMDIMRDQFSMLELPLSVSYRCAQSIVHEAQTIAPEIQPSSTAIHGHVAAIHNPSPTTLEPASAVLCRNTAPLVPLCYQLIRAGKPTTILGRDVAKGLLGIIRTLPPAPTQSSFALWFDAHKSADLAAAKSFTAETRVADRYSTLLAIWESKPQGVTIDQAIQSLFSDDVRPHQITLSTIHKSKGREWKTVYLLYPDLIPSVFATQNWQLTQEDNLLYVAITRAKQNLFYITR